MRKAYRPFTIFVAVSLFIWLLPLGAFIGASQEKTACGGGRAFHMCSMMNGKAQAKGPAKISYSSANTAEKAAKSSAAGGNDFVASGEASRSATRVLYEHARDILFCPQSFQDILVPPPRINLASF